MDEETFDIISVMINRKDLLKRKDKFRCSQGGSVNMCKAMEDWAEELKLEKFSISEQEANNFIEKYWD